MQDGGRTTFARLEDERDAVPALVLDIDDERAVGWATAALWNGIVVKVARFATVQRLCVLPDDDIFWLDRRDRAEHPDFLVSNVLGRKGDGPFHGEDRKELDEIWKSASSGATRRAPHG